MGYLPLHAITEGLDELLVKFEGGGVLTEGDTVPELQARIKRHIQRTTAAKARGDKIAAAHWDRQMKLAAAKLHKLQSASNAPKGMNHTPAKGWPKGTSTWAAPQPAAGGSGGAAKTAPKKAGKGHKGNSFKAIGHEIAKHLHKAVVKAGGHAVGKIPFLSQGKIGKRRIPGLMRKSTAQKLGRKLTAGALKGAGKVTGVAAKLAGKGIAKAAKGAAKLGKRAYQAGREKAREASFKRQVRRDQKRPERARKLADKGAKDYRKKLDAKKQKYQKSQNKLADKGAAEYRLKMQQKVREKHAELQHHKHQSKMREKEHKAELKKKDKDFKKADQAAGEFKKIAHKHSSAADRMRKEIERHQSMTKISPSLVKHAKDRFHHVQKTIGNLFKVTKNKLNKGAMGHQIKGKVQRAADRLRSRYGAKQPKGAQNTQPAAFDSPDIAA